MRVLAFLLLLAAQEPPRFPFDADTAARYQADHAKASGSKPEISNSIGMKLRLIPPGRFQMGNHGSKYRVSLSKSFYIGAAEVTNDQYRRWKPDHRVEGSEPAFRQADRPVARVSWEEAKSFCTWLSERPEEKAAGRVYTLPTQAQWEWAARAGSKEDYPGGDRKLLRD